jgi:hypothetical protein
MKLVRDIFQNDRPKGPTDPRLHPMMSPDSLADASAFSNGSPHEVFPSFRQQLSDFIFVWAAQ